MGLRCIAGSRRLPDSRKPRPSRRGKRPAPGTRHVTPDYPEPAPAPAMAMPAGKTKPAGKSRPARSSGPATGAPVKQIVVNRKARFQYELLDRVEAGIALKGTEVKSLRNGKISLGDAYCRIDRAGEVWLHDAHISPYTHAGHDNHDPLRTRKLLLHKPEIRRLHQRVREKGLTLVPTRLYFKHGRVKVEIALARGKALYDKRDTIKKRDQQREARHDR